MDLSRWVVAGALATLAVAVAMDAAAQQPVGTNDLMALHDIADGESALQLSPGGGSIAMFESSIDSAANRYHNDLIVIELADRRARRVGDGGDIILSASDGRRSGRSTARIPAWSPEGTALAYIARRQDRAELWTSDRSGLAAPAADLPGDVRAFFWSADGALFAETATSRERLWSARAAQQREGFSIDGRFEPAYSLIPRPQDGAEPQFWRIRAGSAAEISRAAYNEARALVSAREAWVGPIDPDAREASPALGVFAMREAAQVQCSAAVCAGALVAAWSDGSASRVVFTRLEGPARALSALYLWDPRSQRIRMLRRGDERISSCVLAASIAYCLQDSATQPRRIIAIDLNNGRSEVLYDPNPHWRSHADWRVERLDITNADGEESFGHLVYPRNYRRGRRYPLVIVQYLSRGFLRGGVGGEAPIFPLAARGYFVLSVDRPEPRALYARLSADDVLRQTELDGSEIAMKLEAIERLLGELSERRLIDENRIAITGMSDGAETLYAALLTSRRFAAAIAASAPRDPSAYWLAAETHIESMREQAGYRAPWDRSDPAWTAWWANAPFYNAERIDTPLMLNLAGSEVLYAAPLIRRLRERHAAMDAFVYPGAYHIKWLPSHLAASQARTMAWIDYWLCGRAPADTALAARWDEMREAAASSAGPLSSRGASAC